ncbi:hypothetical protein [uncultured Parasutterella sp.]|uniref:hypothetical protein n=2 Tax=uncultured Parasutterella sp. TaxID=1263098 RepID=UPI0025B6C966|nr:hypothetical protein [uncultured Parasutterella sp.]
MFELEIEKILIEIKKLETHFSAPVLLLYTPSMVDFTADITHAVLDSVEKQLIKIKKYYKISIDKKVPKIVVALSSSGGNFPTIINLNKLLRENAERYEVLILDRAFSAATLLALLADKIIGSQQALLSTFSPLVSNFMNPNQRAVAISDIELLLSNQFDDKTKVAFIEKLYQEIDPICIAQALRAKRQIEKAVENRYLSSDGNTSMLEKIYKLFLDSSISHNQLLIFRDIDIPCVHKEFLSLTMEETCSNLIELLNKAALPFPPQELVNFFSTSPENSLQFHLHLYFVVSQAGRITSLRRDCISTFSGDKQKVTLPEISVKLSTPYCWNF